MGNKFEKDSQGNGVSEEKEPKKEKSPEVLLDELEEEYRDKHSIFDRKIEGEINAIGRKAEEVIECINDSPILKEYMRVMRGEGEQVLKIMLLKEELSKMVFEIQAEREKMEEGRKKHPSPDKPCLIIKGDFFDYWGFLPDMEKMEILLAYLGGSIYCSREHYMEIKKEYLAKYREDQEKNEKPYRKLKELYWSVFEFWGAIHVLSDIRFRMLSARRKYWEAEREIRNREIRNKDKEADKETR